MQPRTRFPRTVLLLFAIAAGVFVWSAIHPRERVTWLLEVFPAIAGAVILIVTSRRFRFTPLVYGLVAIHAIVLCVGGKYTYAQVPLFNWIRDHFHLSRNHYDRLGHFVQGFVPAMIARELLLRRSPLQRGKWLKFLVICICMAISAWYELFEWLTAAIGGSKADAFLGAQGDPWDTQEDMACAFVGAVLSLWILSRFQDRQMERRLNDPPA